MPNFLLGLLAVVPLSLNLALAQTQEPAVQPQQAESPAPQSASQSASQSTPEQAKSVEQEQKQPEQQPAQTPAPQPAPEQSKPTQNSSSPEPSSSAPSEATSTPTAKPVSGLTNATRLPARLNATQLQQALQDPVSTFKTLLNGDFRPDANINYHFKQTANINTVYAVVTGAIVGKLPEPGTSVRLLVERYREKLDGSWSQPKYHLAVLLPKGVTPDQCNQDTCNVLVTLNPKQDHASSYSMQAQLKVNQLGTNFVWSKQPTFDFVSWYQVAKEGFEVEISLTSGQLQTYSFSLRNLDLSRLSFSDEK